MATLILDPYWEAATKRLRVASGVDERYDEVWDGVLVMSPAPNNEHRRLQSVLLRVVTAVVDDASLGETTFGVNVSDRADDWTGNYRCPDLAVFVKGTPRSIAGHSGRVAPTSLSRSSARARDLTRSWRFMSPSTRASCSSCTGTRRRGYAMRQPVRRRWRPPRSGWCSG